MRVTHKLTKDMVAFVGKDLIEIDFPHWNYNVETHLGYILLKRKKE
jgi:hypothetical protein